MALSHRLAALAAAALMVPALAPAQSNVYRWVDKDGKVQYSDVPPTQEQKGLTQKRLGGGYVDPQMPYAVTVATQKNPVVLYTGAACGDPCREGRDLLARRAVPFTEREVKADSAEAETVKKLVGALVVPVLSVGPKSLKGFLESDWSAALDEAGYPRTPLPGQLPARPAAAPEQAAAPAAAAPAPAAPAAPR
jgi:glutaredoxin